jgi:uncharacterized membrane protein YccC
VRSRPLLRRLTDTALDVLLACAIGAALAVLIFNDLAQGA